MDRIYLKDIDVSACIGVFDWEKQINQKLMISVELSIDLAPAGKQDDLTLGVDYGAVLTRIRQITADSRVQLLEALAEKIAQSLLADFPVHMVVIDIAKVFIFPGVARTGVRIERQRK